MLQHFKGYRKSIRLIKTGRLNKKTTQILIHQKEGKRQEEKLTVEGTFKASYCKLHGPCIL